MRVLNGFRARSALGGLVVAAWSVRFRSGACPGADTRRPPAQSDIRRISIDEAVALALENNLDLQVERIDSADPGPERRRGPERLHADVPLQHRLERADPAAGVSAGRQRQPDRRQQLVVRLRLRRAQQVGRQLQRRRSTTRGPPPTTIFNQLQPAARLERQRQLHAAVAAQLQDRRHAPAAAGVAEEPRDLGRAAAAVDRAHRPQRQERVLRHGVRRWQPRTCSASRWSWRSSRSRTTAPASRSGPWRPSTSSQAEAEVAQREESVILAEAAISRAEDRLRALVFNPSRPDFWTPRIEPTEQVQFRPVHGRHRRRRRATRSHKRTDLSRRASRSSPTTSPSATSRTRRCRT